ncbi:hypothetical protein O3P69_019279 [Scylla paramamosain]|uniref:Uncharacterized protein n=1 Tax=Scylla paramamosain TaxID=85552 RepID=A0AAW0SW43_SCYPA
MGVCARDLVPLPAPRPHALSQVPPPLNLTSLARPDLLLVTPILRSASTTLMHLLRLLAPHRGFSFTPRQRRRAEFVHIPDPKIQDLETCLANPRDIECKYVAGSKTLGHTTEFFCGHHDYCPVFGDREGLAAAKEGVERGWAVVGVLEEWSKTLEVLENYVPRFFIGAKQLYYGHIHRNKTLRNENFYRPNVEEAAKEALKKVFEVEYEFYQFVKQRLDKQYHALASVGV